MKIYNIFKCLSILCITGLIASCEAPAHEEFIQEEETVYVGKPEAIISSPGYHRNKLSWLLVSDPKITKAKVLWTNPQPAEDDEPIPNQRTPGRDSIVIDIERTEGNQLVDVVIDRLVEGVYNFEIFTFDEDENSSIRSEVIGEVYGDTYLSTISNRPLDAAEYYPFLDKGVLSWFGVSQKAVVIDVKYTDTLGDQQTMHITKVPAPDPRNPPYFKEIDTIADYQPGTTIKYRTGYLPSTTAIDTFYTPLREVEVDTAYILMLDELDVLKNTGDIIQYADWDGERWGIPKDWITNDQVQNMGEWGGFDGYNDGGYVSIEKWNDGHDEVENGKIYQTVTLPAGEYIFEVQFDSRNIDDDAYLVSAEGNNLPDVDDVEDDAIAYEEIEDDGDGSQDLEFSLAEETEVSIGFLINFFENRQNFRAHNIKLYKKEWR